MSKTITIRLDDMLYSVFKKAADGERRSISNFIEWATLAYLKSDMSVDEKEMDEIRKYSSDLKKGLEQAKKGKYKIVQ